VPASTTKSNNQTQIKRRDLRRDNEAIIVDTDPLGWCPCPKLITSLLSIWPTVKENDGLRNFCRMPSSIGKQVVELSIICRPLRYLFDCDEDIGPVYTSMEKRNLIVQPLTIKCNISKRASPHIWT